MRRNKSVSGILISVLLLICSQKISLAQQTLIYSDTYADYKKAMELYENKMYASAQELFNKVAVMIPEATDTEIFTYISNSRYYSAICAIELENPDAEKLMLDFI